MTLADMTAQSQAINRLIVARRILDYGREELS